MNQHDESMSLFKQEHTEIFQIVQPIYMRRKAKIKVNALIFFIRQN